MAEEAVGDFAQAYQDLRESLKCHDPWFVENRALLDEELDKLKKQIALITIRSSPREVTVRFNNAAHGVSLPVGVLPGKVYLRVEAPAFRAQSGELIATAGERVNASVRLSSIAGAPPRRSLWLWLAGGGGLMAISAVAPWALAGARTSELQRTCRAGSNCPVFSHKRSEVEQLDVFTNVLLIAGTLSAAAFFTIYWFDHREPTPDFEVGFGLTGISQRLRF
jgi:hypothetical protein